MDIQSKMRKEFPDLCQKIPLNEWRNLIKVYEERKSLQKQTQNEPTLCEKIAEQKRIEHSNRSQAGKEVEKLEFNKSPHFFEE